jgi:hypothetical protein
MAAESRQMSWQTSDQAEGCSRTRMPSTPCSACILSITVNTRVFSALANHVTSDQVLRPTYLKNGSGDRPMRLSCSVLYSASSIVPVYSMGYYNIAFVVSGTVNITYRAA